MANLRSWFRERVGGIGLGSVCLLCHALANVVVVIGRYVTVAFAQVVHRIAVSWVG